MLSGLSFRTLALSIAATPYTAIIRTYAETYEKPPKHKLAIKTPAQSI